MNRAIAWTLLGRAWSSAAGPVTLLLIAHNLTGVEQGYYYTFASITGLQVFFELGLSFVVMQKASHEKALLEWTEAGVLQGDKVALQRVCGIFTGALKWYAGAALIFMIVVLLVGRVYFGNFGGSDAVNWRGPWMTTAIAQALLLGTVPAFAILEGCGRVSDVAKNRWLQAAMSNVSVWVLLLAGAKLWASAAMPIVTLLVGVICLLRFRPLFRQLRHTPHSGSQLDWRKEILPFQWRIGVSWVSGYFMFQLFTPIIFAYHGAREAGCFGMTFNLVNAVASGPLAWISTKAPAFGEHVARRMWDKLDELFARTMKQSGLVLLVAYTILILGLYLAKALSYAFVDRLLEPELVILLSGGAIVNHILMSVAYYLRAHGKEPLLTLSLVTGLINAALSLTLGRYFGVTGISWGYFASQCLVVLPWSVSLFYTYRLKYHAA